MFDTILM